MTKPPEHHEVIVVGGGVCGIYQIKRLVDLGIDAIVLEGAGDLGGTWFNNRYPGCRFDSESYTYGFTFSRALLDEWDWSERFSPQPENLRYLQHVAARFDLKRHMRFDARVASAHFDDERVLWRLALDDGRTFTCRHMILAIGNLSIPTLPQYPGMDTFQGKAFHTFHWPHDPVDLASKRVAVIGTGATAIQLIPAIAPTVAQLTVFQRRPNWSAPLGNGPLSSEEMTDIRRRYDDIFAVCARTATGFIHEPDPRSFHDVAPEERVALWDQLYSTPGFALWLSNFREIFMEDEANAAVSAYVAERIRGRVKDPKIAEKLIPRDHGFGTQRLPMETNYFEAYNRDNVRLVDTSETPIQRVTATGLETSAESLPFDIIVYATGFDAITGAFDRIDIRGSGGVALRDAWRETPSTFLGMMVHGFPNLFMPSGPQSGSPSTNYPRGIETGVNWCTELLAHARARGFTRVEATAQAEAEWNAHVVELYEHMLMRRAQSWFTGYNSNVAGHEKGSFRPLVYNGGAAKYSKKIRQVVEAGYEGVRFGR